MLSAINGATTMPYGLCEDIVSAAQAGISGVELWWDKIETYLESEPASSLAALLDEKGVVPAGICPFPVSPFRNTLENRSRFQLALDVAEAISCTLLTVCPEFCPMDTDPEEAKSRLADEFRWYAAAAAEYGIRLAIEPISRHTLVRGPVEALRIIELAGEPENLGLLIDTFHYSCSCVRSEEIRRIPREKLYIVHLNDSRNGMREELTDADRLYPTEGCIDLKTFMTDLRAIGYDGFLSVELFNRAYWQEPIGEICRKARESYERVLRL